MVRFYALAFAIFCEVLLSSPLFCQEQNDSSFLSVQEAISQILQDIEDDFEAENITAELLNLAENPVQINKATDEQWQKLFWLSEFQIQSVKSYIHTIGSVSSYYELLYIPGISKNDALLLSPFIGFERTEFHKKVSLSRFMDDGQFQWLLRNERIIEKQLGYTNTGTRRFTGGPLKLLNRVTYKLDDDIHIGYTAEKDAGEPIFSKSNKQGFDFNSFHAQLNTHGLFKTIILGDYQVSLGQGLICGAGYNPGKTGLVMSSMRHLSGINHYQVTDENKFYRGIAVVLDYKPVSITLFGSRHAIDANITVKDSSTNKTKEVSSLQTTGIHSISSEIADEDAINQSLTGGRIGINKNNYSMGCSFISNELDAKLNPALKLYNHYYFRGSQNYNASFDYQIHLKNLILFGEEAVSKNGGYALLNGFQTYINSRISCCIISRWYQPSFQSIAGKAFGENSTCSNEYGLFMGCEFLPYKFTSVNVFMDVYRFPWLKYGIDIPSAGHEFMVQFNFFPKDNLRMYVQYRNKIKQDLGGDSIGEENQIIDNATNRLRYNFMISSGRRLKFNTRLDYSSYNTGNKVQNHGMYVGQDISVILSKLPVEIDLHAAWFNTDSSTVRIYAYEPDMLYSYSIPVMSNKGYRAFIMLKYRLGKKWFFWLKYDRTSYFNRNAVGTDLNMINGNTRSEIKFQLMKKF